MRTTIAAIVFALVAVTGGARADPTPPTPGELRMEMRRIWDDQATYTRNFIIAALEMSPDQGPVIDAFLSHQVVIAGALAPFYGEAASNQLALLLREHVFVTGDLLRTISEGDVERVPRAHANWVDNCQQIAAYLAMLNPRWNRKQLDAALQAYLDLTMDEIAGRSIRNWEHDVTAYERVSAHTARLADFISNGIIRQFPERFR